MRPSLLSGKLGTFRQSGLGRRNGVEGERLLLRRRRPKGAFCFSASPLYRDFLETRAGVLLGKLQQASSAAERETFLQAFCKVAATIDGERSSQGDRLIQQTGCGPLLWVFTPTPKRKGKQFSEC